MWRTIFLCLCLCGNILIYPAWAEDTEKAELTSLSGSAQVLLQGSDDYTGAEEGMELKSGDKIKTGNGGSVEVSFNSDNTNLVRLSENTRVEISLSGDEKLQMSEGEVFASVNSLSGSSAFEIRTPTAVSGARGTDWVTKVTEEGTDVEAIDSQPYVRHFETSGKLSSQPTFITPGEMTTVKRFQKPTAFRPIQEGRRQQWQALKQDVRRRAGEAIQKRQQRQPFNRNEFMRKIRQQKNPSVFRPLQTGQQDEQNEFKPQVSGGSKQAKELTVGQQPLGGQKQFPPNQPQQPKPDNNKNKPPQRGAFVPRGGGGR